MSTATYSTTRPQRYFVNTYICPNCENEFEDTMLTVSQSWCPACEAKCEPDSSRPVIEQVPVEDITKVYVQRDTWPERESPRHTWHMVEGWMATLYGLDEDVAIGRGKTPLKAIADLLWEIDREEIDPAGLNIVWE